jgi:hypothetical protein
VESFPVDVARTSSLLFLPLFYTYTTTDENFPEKFKSKNFPENFPPQVDKPVDF